MNETEAALYWATRAWTLPEGAVLSQLPEAERRVVVREVERVRQLYKEAHEPLFASYNGVQRPLSREVTWIGRRTTEVEPHDKYVAWLRRAKVGDRYKMEAVFGSGSGETTEPFVCERIA
jgi:hypothetical protein